MAPHFGNKVVGDEAYDEAVRAEKGGGHIFGVRVRGAIPETGPTNIAKRNTEHGVRVVNTVREEDSVSVEELKNILAENPTFFDSLFEAELARPEGARPDALKVFESVEMGIKGQGRRDVLDDIATLLGKRSEQAAAAGNLAQAKREQIRAMNERVRANTKKGVIPVSTSEGEVRRIANGEGLDLPGDGVDVDEAHLAGAKPGGSTRPETQQPGAHPLVPKGESGEAVDYDELSKAELEEHAARLGVDPTSITGTGANGRVVRDDLLKAVKKAAKRQES